MNKILSGLIAATAMVFSSSSMAVLSVGIDTSSYGNTGGLQAFDGSFSGDTVVSDNQAGDLSPTQNHIMAMSFPGVQINVSSISSNPFNLHMGANMFGSGTVTFGVTATGLTIQDLANAVFSVGGAGFADSAVSAYIDTSNQAFGIDDQLASVTQIGANSGDPSAYFYSSGQFILNSLNLASNDLFSLTIIATVYNDGSNSGGSSVDSHINVPEPSVIALLGLGLAGIGFVAARRRKQTH